MGAGLAVGLGLLVAGIIVFAIGAGGTFSIVQVGIGIFLGVVGALMLVASVKSNG